MDFKELVVNENITVRESLKHLNDTAKGVLFLERNQKLVAAVSDGDIRRWILKYGSLDDAISNAANYAPKYVEIENRDAATAIMTQGHFEAIPVVDIEHHIVDIEFLYRDEEKNRNQIKIPVVIMAGGRGTRLYPYTKILPKPLIPIGDIPISEHIVNRFHDNGCEDFFFIVNYKKNMIKAYFNEIERDYHVTYVDEEKPLGTGGGVGLLKGLISSTFILTNCDSIIQSDYSEILKVHREKKNLVTMICSLRNYEVPYGVVEIGENGSIKSMKEKPSMSYFTNTGTYIVEPDVIDMMEPDTYIGFPDVIDKLKKSGKNVGVYPVNEREWLDMGQFDTMETMKRRLHIED